MNPIARFALRFRPQATTLEDRTVPSAVPTSLSAVRSYDGSGNNLAHAAWGRAGTDFLRLAAAAYADGISTPAGADRPSARAISNAVSDGTGTTGSNDRQMSAFVYAWGQFVDHDIDLTPTGTTERLPIPVPTGDPSFDPAGTGTKTIGMSRSTFDPATGTSTANPRQQVNANSAYLDGSMVDGSDATTATSLRTLSGGRLKTSAGDMLPTDAAGNDLAGDGRVNENPELTSLQTVFLREHNRIAGTIAAADPRLTDEQVYQQARARVVGEIEAITVNEWLPALLGRGLNPYTGYNPAVDAGIANEFATAGYRSGHSLLVDDIQFLGNDGTSISPGVALKDAFNNPALVAAHGIDPLLKYLASDPTNEVDTKVVDSVRNFLFGAPGAGGFDLASLNVQRGRDHGLADYNTTRAAYGLPRVTSFAQITADPAMQAKLKQLYGTVDTIDLWVGVLAEDHTPGGSVGPTDRAILVDQFSRLRDGDRFWYQNSFRGPALDALDRTRLTEVIRRNTALTCLQPNAFFFKADVSGTAFGDGNRDGRRQPGEAGLPGITVTLRDADGVVVATTTTGPRGDFHFGVAEGLRTGRYTVEGTLPAGSTATSPAVRTVTITGGDQSAVADFGSIRVGGNPLRRAGRPRNRVRLAPGRRRTLARSTPRRPPPDPVTRRVLSTGRTGDR